MSTNQVCVPSIFLRQISFLFLCSIFFLIFVLLSLRLLFHNASSKYSSWFLFLWIMSFYNSSSLIFIRLFFRFFLDRFFHRFEDFHLQYLFHLNLLVWFFYISSSLHRFSFDKFLFFEFYIFLWSSFFYCCIIFSITKLCRIILLITQ